MTVIALNDRRPALLGGSTIAAACGVDPWCSPIRLWLDLRAGREREETEAMRWGKRLEPAILEEVLERGYAVERCDHDPYHDPERPWLVGHPDGFTIRASGERWILEVKTASQWTHTTVPPQYEAQVQTYMHLTGLDKALLATLVGGQRLVLSEIARRPHVIEILLRLAEEFVGYVRSDTQPPVAGHPDDRAALLLACPDAQRITVRETREVQEARRELASLLAAEKARKARIEHLRAVITDHMGEADTLVSLHDEPVATWRNVTARRLDTDLFKKERPHLYDTFLKETTTRRLTLQ